MLEKVREHIARQDLVRPGDKVLVSVSGGPDSTALLHILWRLSGEAGWRLGVFHLDHGLRGEESRQDAVFVENLARDLNLPFYLRTVPVGKLKERARGSVQASARRLRQEIWLEVARAGGWECIALGHQRDDQAETVLMRFLRGAGPGGLAGIAPVSDLKGIRLVRPLLETPREDILSYCREHELAYREDSSNVQPVYRRNRLRLELLPHLEQEYNPNLRQALVRTARVLRDDEDYLRSQAREELRRVQRSGSHSRADLDLGLLKEMHPALRRRVLQMAAAPFVQQGQELHSTHLFQLEQLVNEKGPGRKLDLPGGVQAYRGYRCLSLDVPGPPRKERSRGAWVLPVPGRLVAPDWKLVLEADYGPASAPFSIPESGQVQMAAARVPLPLVLRGRRRGDRFRLRGLGGSKKLQDYLVDCQVPRHRRPAVALLADSRGDLVGIPGWRWDERCDPAPGEAPVVRVRWRELVGHGPTAPKSEAEANKPANAKEGRSKPRHE